jgi:hypothetical protein
MPRPATTHQLNWMHRHQMPGRANSDYMCTFSKDLVQRRNYLLKWT